MEKKQNFHLESSLFLCFQFPFVKYKEGDMYLFTLFYGCSKHFCAAWILPNAYNAVWDF